LLIRAVFENLHLEVDGPLRTRYQDLFKSVSELRSMPDILTHHYGLPGSGIKWPKVWVVLEMHFEREILKKLEEAINKKTRQMI